MMALPSNLSIVAKASRPKIDDTLLKRDISDIPSGMYSSETKQNKKSHKNFAFCGNCLSPLMAEQFSLLAAKWICGCESIPEMESVRIL